MIQPIKSKKKIKAMLALLKGGDKTGRNAMLFRLGINSALRISDLLSLRFDDVFCSPEYRFREYIHVTDQKTGKKTNFKPSEEVRAALKSYAKKNKLKKGDWLFFSLKNKRKALDRTNAWRMLKKNANTVGIQNVGTHSLRKTFGFHYYQATHDIALLMQLFNHSSQHITLRYIGLEQEAKDKAYAEIESIYES
jgi:integrase